MFEDASHDTTPGRRGATRRSWQEYNPRVLVKQVMDANPTADVAAICKLVRKALADEPQDYADSFIDYATENAFNSLGGYVPLRGGSAKPAAHGGGGGVKAWPGPRGSFGPRSNPEPGPTPPKKPLTAAQREAAKKREQEQEDHAFAFVAHQLRLGYIMPNGKAFGECTLDYIARSGTAIAKLGKLGSRTLGKTVYSDDDLAKVEI